VTSFTSLSFFLEKTGARSDLFPLEHGISGEQPGSISLKRARVLNDEATGRFKEIEV
jgi:hypothetical protein